MFVLMLVLMFVGRGFSRDIRGSLLEGFSR